MLPDDSFHSAPHDSEPPDRESRDSDARLTFADKHGEQNEAESPRPTATLRCPVCRARQPLQTTCRRCKADLGLLVAALREVARLQSQHGQALADGDQEAASRIADQLRQLQGGGKG